MADHCPPLSVAAFRAAIGELKAAQPNSAFSISGGNTLLSAGITNIGPNPALYAELVSRARELLISPASNQAEHQAFLSAGAAAKVASDSLFSFDQSFHTSQLRHFNEIQHNLENSLSVQKRDGEREQVKVALINLAEFYFNRGDLNASLNKYLESKEFVNQTATAHTNMELLNISLNIIKCSILMMNMSHVKTQVQRAQRLWKEVVACNQQASSGGGAAAASSASNAEKEEREGKIIAAKLNAAIGLFNMKSTTHTRTIK